MRKQFIIDFIKALANELNTSFSQVAMLLNDRSLEKVIAKYWLHELQPIQLAHVLVSANLTNKILDRN